MIRNLITLQRSVKWFCFGCMFSVVEKKLFIEFACNAFLERNGTYLIAFANCFSTFAIGM